MSHPNIIPSVPSHPLDQTQDFPNLWITNSTPGVMSVAQEILRHSYCKLETNEKHGHLGLRQVVGHTKMWESASEWISETCRQRWDAEDKELGAHQH